PGVGPPCRATIPPPPDVPSRPAWLKAMVLLWITTVPEQARPPPEAMAQFPEIVLLRMVKGFVLEFTATPAPRWAVLCENVQPLTLDGALTEAERPPPAPVTILPPSAWLPLTTQSVMVKEVWKSPPENTRRPPPFWAVLSVKREREIVTAPAQPTPPPKTPAEWRVRVGLAMVVSAALRRMPPPKLLDSLVARLPETVQPLTVRAFTWGEA